MSQPRGGPGPATYVRQPYPYYIPSEEDSGISGFWEKYKVWIIAFAALAIGIGVYFWMKTKQDEAERNAKKQRLEDRLKADHYAEQRAQQLASIMVDKALKEKGVRHDIGDPGIQSDLGASHDWETNPKQRASPADVAIDSEINQIADPDEHEQE